MTSAGDGKLPGAAPPSVERSAFRDALQASGGHFGKAAWISPARIHGTRRIRQKQRELRDDGNLDGRRLRKALGERNEGFTLLEHHPRPDRNERRCRSATRGERHECMEPCRDLPSLGQRP